MDFRLNGFSLLFFLKVYYLIASDVLAQSNYQGSHIKIKKDDKMCEKQVELLVVGYQRKEIWALKVFDSWGKSQSGLFSGNVMNFGHYEQCLQMSHKFEDSADGVFQGQHCMIFFKDSEKVVNESLRIQDLILPTTVHIELLRQYINFYNQKLGTAMCLPSTCTTAKVRQIADRMLAHNSLKTTRDYNQENFCNTINILDMRPVDMFAA